MPLTGCLTFTLFAILPPFARYTHKRSAHCVPKTFERRKTMRFYREMCSKTPYRVKDYFTLLSNRKLFLRSYCGTRLEHVKSVNYIISPDACRNGVIYNKNKSVVYPTPVFLVST